MSRKTATRNKTPVRARKTMCVVNAAGDVPPAGRDTDVYYVYNYYCRRTAAAVAADANAAAVVLSQGKWAAAAAAIHAARLPACLPVKRILHICVPCSHRSRR